MINRRQSPQSRIISYDRKKRKRKKNRHVYLSLINVIRCMSPNSERDSDSCISQTSKIFTVRRSWFYSRFECSRVSAGRGRCCERLADATDGVPYLCDSLSSRMSPCRAPPSQSGSHQPGWTGPLALPDACCRGPALLGVGWRRKATYGDALFALVRLD